MIRLEIKNEEALEELKEAYNLTRLYSFLKVVRVVLDKLLEEETDCEAELLFPVRFLNKSYQLNPTLFARSVKKGMTCLITSRRVDNDIILHAGYIHRPRSFFGRVVFILKNPRTRALDIKKDHMPESFRDQPFVLRNRLVKKIGCDLRLIDLGDEFRFAKIGTDIPKKHKKYEVKTYKLARL